MVVGSPTAIALDRFVQLFFSYLMVKNGLGQWGSTDVPQTNKQYFNHAVISSGISLMMYTNPKDNPFFKFNLHSLNQATVRPFAKTQVLHLNPYQSLKILYVNVFFYDRIKI